jgi:signal transduction histidine kinase
MLTSIRLVRQFTSASLIAVVVVAFVLASFYAWKAQAALVEQGEQKNATQVRLMLNQLNATDRAALDELLAVTQKPAADSAPVTHLLQTFRQGAAGTSIVKLKLYNTRGMTVFSTETRQIGEDKSTYPGFVGALSGSAESQLSERETFESMFGSLRAVAVIGSYLPVPDRNGKVVGVIEVYDDVTQLFHAIDAARWEVFGLSALLMLVLYATLLYIVRRGSRRVALKERTLEHEVVQRGRLYSEAVRAQQATAQQQRETEKAYSIAMAARRTAEEANQSKTELLGKLGEEMRTPLNGMIGTTDVLLMSELSSAQREHVTRVRAGASALLQLANDLLAVAQPEAEVQEPRLEALSPLTLAREATSLHAALARANGLTMECRAASTAPDWALGDARRLRLLLTDLVGVAGRSGRGKTVVIAIERVLNVPGLALRFDVRVEPGNAGGSGDPLDLHAARRLAAKLNGSIDVESGVGQALVLRLQVPLRPAGIESPVEPVAGVPTEAAP